MTRWLDRRIAAPGPWLALCLSEREHAGAMKRLKIKHPAPWVNPGAHATTHVLDTERGSGSACVVCLDWSFAKKRPDLEVVGLLIHEAVHVWQTYARRIGEHHPGDEQEAYAIQSIAQ